MDTPPRHTENDVDEAAETSEVRTLTVNQLVAYNLMRARRRMGWTQQETAEKLGAFSLKRWTAATLSAAERSWQTGRSRDFDANELVSFSCVFEQPVSYFFLPIKPAEGQEIHYSLTRMIEDRVVFRALDTKELLDVAVPLRYPASLIDQVNSILSTMGITWAPDARVERYSVEEAVDWSEVVRHTENRAGQPQDEEQTPDEDRLTDEALTTAGVDRNSAMGRMVAGAVRRAVREESEALTRTIAEKVMWHLAADTPMFDLPPDSSGDPGSNADDRSKSP